MASANALATLRWKRVKIHRGSRRLQFTPDQEGGYTSAVVTLDQRLPNPLQSGGVHIRPDMTMPKRDLRPERSRIACGSGVVSLARRQRI
jgi:hypothetical protein